jgi:transitional endoplasmic reticulum ATPase
VERRVVAQLLTLMDGLGDRGNVIVVAATNREDSIDPALRRPGRFDREIEIGIPGRKARSDILNVHLRDMPLTDDVSVDVLAGMTQGYVGADLAALCREAAMKCVRTHMKDLDLDKPIPMDVLEEMKVSLSDFKDALADVEPSGMREVLVEIPKVTWDDVGGLDDVREQIAEAFVPEEGNKSYERLGIEPAKGVLLYGPPGTGKTLIAKAIANEAGSNFITVNGPEVASKWMGESEKAIRQIFKRAKQMAPCIIFFDEIDSIAPIRGGEDGSAWERVVAQLLTSMDGVESLNNVMVMAATNRPDMIDPALLRPGRFDKLVLVGKPDLKARRNILDVHTRKMPLKDVDLDFIAAKTDGYVGADLAALCREAGLVAYRRDHDSENVTMDDFEEALKKIMPSVDSNMFQNYANVEKNIKKRRSGWDNVPFYG